MNTSVLIDPSYEARLDAWKRRQIRAVMRYESQHGWSEAIGSFGLLSLLSGGLSWWAISAELPQPTPALWLLACIASVTTCLSQWFVMDVRLSRYTHQWAKDHPRPERLNS